MPPASSTDGVEAFLAGHQMAVDLGTRLMAFLDDEVCPVIATLYDAGLRGDDMRQAVAGIATLFRGIADELETQSTKLIPPT